MIVRQGDGYSTAVNTFARSSSGVPQRAGSFLDFVKNVREARDKNVEEDGTKKLSAQEIAELAGKYDPHHMTQNQYDSFLDELEQKGVLSRTDKMMVKDPDMRFGSIDWEVFIATGGQLFGCGGGVAINESPLTARLRSLEEADGDVARLVKAMLEYECELAGRGTPVIEDHQRIAALRTVSDILDRMSTV